MKTLKMILSGAALLLAAATGTALAHGDMAPQPVDTKDLPKLGEAWLPENPYRGNTKAIEIGAAAFNQNCARCHGLGAVSGGIAPDLRYLPTGLDGDEWFLTRIRGGSTRDGRVYMPKFEGILSQEAMWSIRAWLETVHEE
ncbi:cytochrome c-550 PedF [Rhodomicrobium lacus]|uniref:cytochrome c-550 PedF n=1 Tax=Rhodomicrobium lacus TaxID=2498452 RepID=UPI0026E36CDA|nr:cytochrome c-550 PedF [Rhodomicrobium lacus]WKW51375.1 cytochrome c-550 PedF [Rhodomicrobium lacus]